MTKEEAKEALHQLFSKWRNECSGSKLDHPSFVDFKTWLRESGYSHYMKFRSSTDANDDVEIWFDNYFNQSWRR